MPSNKKPMPFPSALLLAGLVALLAAGCARSPAFKALAEQPADYRVRHPILLTRTTQSAAIAVGPYSASITSLQRSAIDAFAKAFRGDGEGSLAIVIPTGSSNERAASRLAHEAHGILAAANVPPGAIVTRSYRADPAVPSPPILLSYQRLTAAVPHPCAASGDIDITIYNQQWEDFGCANHTNLAAIIANPNDLTRPRPLDQASAGRRATILQKYNTGEDPKTRYINPGAGSASTLGAGG